MRNRGRFARRIRPKGRGWMFNSGFPKDGRFDRDGVMVTVRREPEEKRWLRPKYKMAVSAWVLKEKRKIRVDQHLPACVSRRNDMKW